MPPRDRSAYYQAHKEMYRKAALASYHRLGHVRQKQRVGWRSAYIDSLKVGGCVDCGNKNLGVLHFDHLRDKKTNVSLMVFRSFAEIDAEVSKCEVRCANCHQIKTNARRREKVA